MPTIVTRGLGYDSPTIVVQRVASRLVATVRVQERLIGVVRTIQRIVGILSEEGPYMTLETNRITMFIRDNRDLLVTVSDDDGDPKDLTGAKIWFTVKEKLTDSDANAKIQKRNTAAGGGPTEIEVTNPTGGQCEVHLVPADTEDLDPATYHYDIQVLLADGKTYTVTRDRITFKEDVTRSS